MTKPSTVTFTSSDGATIEANIYAGSSHAVILGHGKVFDKESWSEVAQRLNDIGLTVIAPNFRGYGKSKGPDADDGFAQDIAAAAAYGRRNGATAISLLGGSMGAVAVSKAVTDSLISDVYRLILLSPRVAGDPGKINVGHALFVVSKDEDCAQTVQSMHDQCPSPKSLQVFDGDKHAQFLFQSGHKDTLISMILDALKQ